jgi:uncharacterized protein YutE (UPF0331/DUF86 family)
VDREIIDQKLESLRRAVRRVAEKCPESAGELASDFDAQDVVALNLTRAVQLCVDIGAHLIAGTEVKAPDTMGQVFDALVQTGIVDANLASRLKKAVGFRNIAVHNYQAIDWTIVHAICRKRLNDFEEFAKVVMSRVSGKE